MDSLENDGFKDFEKIWTQKLEDRNAFESLSNEDLSAIIKGIERSCFILELQNEVIEKYLQRHNPSCIRELDAYMAEIENEDSKSCNKIFTTINGHSSFHIQREEVQHSFSSEEHENDVTGKVIEIINQEIADLCMHSKINKKAFNNEIFNLTCELESYKSQASLLKNIFESMNEHIPDELKGRPSKISSKLQEMIKYMEGLTRKVIVDIRKSTIEVNNLKREYIQLHRDFNCDGKPIIIEDFKLLQAELEKLQNDNTQLREVLLDLTHSLDMVQVKLNSQKSESEALKLKMLQLNNTMNRLNEVHMTVERYRNVLEKKLKTLEAEKEELNKLSDIKCVPSPKSYIHLKEKYSATIKKKKKSAQK